MKGFCMSSRAMVVESPWPVRQTVSGGRSRASLESERRIAASSPPGKIGAAVPTRKQGVAHKGNVPLLGGSKQDDPARRMPWRLDHLQADIAHLESIALGEQTRRLPRVGRLNAPHSSLFLDVRMRHRHILRTQLILTALANGGSHAGNTTNMIGMAMSAHDAKHAYAGMLGSEYALPSARLPMRGR